MSRYGDFRGDDRQTNATTMLIIETLGDDNAEKWRLMLPHKMGLSLVPNRVTVCFHFLRACSNTLANMALKNFLGTSPFSI